MGEPILFPAPALVLALKQLPSLGVLLVHAIDMPHHANGLDLIASHLRGLLGHQFELAVPGSHQMSWRVPLEWRGAPWNAWQQPSQPFLFGWCRRAITQLDRSSKTRHHGGWRKDALP